MLQRASPSLDTSPATHKSCLPGSMPWGWGRNCRMAPVEPVFLSPPQSQERWRA